MQLDWSRYTYYMGQSNVSNYTLYCCNTASSPLAGAEPTRTSPPTIVKTLPIVDQRRALVRQEGLSTTHIQFLDRPQWSLYDRAFGCFPVDRHFSWPVLPKTNALSSTATTSSSESYVSTSIDHPGFIAPLHPPSASSSVCTISMPPISKSRHNNLTLLVL